MVFRSLRDDRNVDEGPHQLILDATIIMLILTLMTGNIYFTFALNALYKSMVALPTSVR